MELTTPQLARGPSPTARTMLPAWTALESPIRAAGTSPASTLSTARSTVGSRPARVAETERPSGRVRVMSSSVCTVWSAVTTRPGRQCTPVEPIRRRAVTPKMLRLVCCTAAASPFERVTRSFMCPPLAENRWPQHACLAGSWVSPRWAGKDAGRDLAGDAAFHYHGRASIAGRRCAHPYSGGRHEGERTVGPLCAVAAPRVLLERRCPDGVQEQDGAADQPAERARRGLHQLRRRLRAQTLGSALLQGHRPAQLPVHAGRPRLAGLSESGEQVPEHGPGLQHAGELRIDQ